MHITLHRQVGIHFSTHKLPLIKARQHERDAAAAAVLIAYIVYQLSIQMYSKNSESHDFWWSVAGSEMNCA